MIFQVSRGQHDVEASGNRSKQPASPLGKAEKRYKKKTPNDKSVVAASDNKGKYALHGCMHIWTAPAPGIALPNSS